MSSKLNTNRLASDIDELSISSSVNDSDQSPENGSNPSDQPKDNEDALFSLPTRPKSYSMPPPKPITHDGLDPTASEKHEEKGGTVYSMTTATCSAAYNYMASFYGPQQIMDPASRMDSKSRSLSAIHGPAHSPQSDASSKRKHGAKKLHKMSPVGTPKTSPVGTPKMSPIQTPKYLVPDLINYPMSPTAGSAATDSDLIDRLQTVSANGHRVKWAAKISEPEANNVPLRTPSYKVDGVKDIGQSTLFRLVAAQSFDSELMMDHIAMHPVSWYNQNMARDDLSAFTFIIHLQVRSIKCSFISYHVLSGDLLGGYNANGSPIVRGDPAATKLLDIVMQSDTAERNQRFKLIPRVVDGPYPVKRVVENRPVLLGNKVTMRYFRGPNYFEIDAKVDESMVAASIIKLCHRFAKRIVVDMAWTIQGELADELPERMLCGVTIHNMDFSQCHNIEAATACCHKLRYFEKAEQKNDD